MIMLAYDDQMSLNRDIIRNNTQFQIQIEME